MYTYINIYIYIYIYILYSYYNKYAVNILTNKTFYICD